MLLVLTNQLRVVNDTEYRNTVPVGINIWSSLNSVRGIERIPTVWHMTFHAMTLSAQRLR